MVMSMIKKSRSLHWNLWSLITKKICRFCGTFKRGMHSSYLLVMPPRFLHCTMWGPSKKLSLIMLRNYAGWQSTFPYFCIVEGKKSDREIPSSLWIAERDLLDTEILSKNHFFIFVSQKKKYFQEIVECYKEQNFISLIYCYN